jgi:hypothetical protein
VLDRCRNLCTTGHSTRLEAVPDAGIETPLQDLNVMAFMNCTLSEGLLTMSTHIEPKIELRPSWSACVLGVVDFLRTRPDHAVLLCVVGLQDVHRGKSNQNDGPDGEDQKPALVRHLMRALCMQPTCAGNQDHVDALLWADRSARPIDDHSQLGTLLSNAIFLFNANGTLVTMGGRHFVWAFGLTFYLLSGESIEVRRLLVEAGWSFFTSVFSLPQGQRCFDSFLLRISHCGLLILAHKISCQRVRSTRSLVYRLSVLPLRGGLCPLFMRSFLPHSG